MFIVSNKQTAVISYTKQSDKEHKLQYKYMYHVC